MIQLEQVQLRQGGRILFDQATFQLHPGWKIGLTGVNGAGKSSLFAALQGTLAIDQGSLQRPSQWTVAHMAQEIEASDISALDFVCAGDAEWLTLSHKLAQADTLSSDELMKAQERFDDIGGYRIPALAAQMLDGLGFKPADHARSVRDFSGGWRMRLGLARTLMSRSDLLLLDEPTNHLDLDALLWLEQWLQQYQGTLLLISHDRDFLDQVIDHVLHIEQQQLSLYSGNFTQFETMRAERLAQQQQAYDKQQLTRQHLQKYIDRFKASATRAKQAQSRVKQLERMQQLAPAHADSPFSFSFISPGRFTSPLIQVQQADIGYQDKTILKQVNLAIGDQARIGLLGQNGAGKSTLIKSLVGALPLLSGTIHASDSLRLGYFAQQQIDNLDLQASPLVQLNRLNPSRISDADLRAFLGSFGFGANRLETPCEHFSGGEKARLSLALLVWQKPNLLILDEPTNHLDMAMRLALSMALQAFEGALILVSHDREMLRNTCDEFFLVAHGEVKPFEGDIDDYVRWLRDQRKLEKVSEYKNDKNQKLDAKISQVSRETQRQRDAQRRDQLRPLKKAIEQLEKKLDQLNSEAAQLEGQLADEALYQPEQKAKLLAVLAAKQANLVARETTEEDLLMQMMALEELEASLA